MRELLIPLDQQAKKPLYEQIYTFIRDEIRGGAIPEGGRLPSTRALSQNLHVSRSTVQLAYDQLLAEGYLVSVPCRGYFAAGIDELVDAGSFQQAVQPREASHPVRTPVKFEIDFSPWGIDLAGFPANTWRRLSKRTLDGDSAVFGSGNPQGEPALREAVAAYLHAARGVNCLADQVVIGAGSEYLLMLLTQILDTPKKIAMENPTYRQAGRVFESLGYEVFPVEIDASGMDPLLLSQSGAPLAYVMPSHQFPTGVVMSAGRRQELLRWAAREEGCYLIEDDYDSEFRYRGKPIPALQGLDRRGQVIYIGTFSKCIAPAIRISYLVLPPALLAAYRKKAGFYASTVSRIDQNILCGFLAEGHFERHLNRMRAVYKAKHDCLLRAVEPLEEDFIVSGEYAGTHILLTARSPRPETELLERAAAAGVRVYGLTSCLIRPVPESARGTVLLGYASLSEEEIRRGIELLAACWLKT